MGRVVLVDVLVLVDVDVVVEDRVVEAVDDDAVTRVPSTSVLTRDSEAASGSGRALAPRTAVATRPTATNSVIQRREVMRERDP